MLFPELPPWHDYPTAYTGPGRVRSGIDGGLKGLREQPFGMYMLAAVGVGLICYGIYMMVRSKLGKM
jgi:hypothetical protein